MSVYISAAKCVRIIFNKQCRPLVSSAVTYLNLQPPYYIYENSNNIKYSNVRSIYTIPKLCKKISFNLSDIGEGIREVVVKEWFVKVGDKVSQFDNICEVQSDKASVTITSRYDGIVTKLYYDVEATALVGQPLIDIESEEASTEQPSTDSQKKNVAEAGDIKKVNIESPPPTTSSKLILCLPSVRRLAEENKVNLELIKGSGKDGRILKEDVLKFLEKPQVGKVPTATSTGAADRIEPIKGFQKAMVKTMTASLKIPHFGYSDEFCVSKLNKIRKQLKGNSEREGVKLTFLPFFVKAASNALINFPILNTSTDQDCENIIYKSAHNIGIAMDTAVGLAVPVVKNVEKLNIVEIAKEIKRLMKNGKTGSFSREDLAGGTITISNIGGIGGTYLSPIILPPQVAIIAIGALKVFPKFDKDGTLVAEEILCINSSADHRIVDGATMARFINAIKIQIENPYMMLIH